MAGNLSQTTSDTFAGARASFKTAAERALLRRTDLKIFCDAKNLYGSTEVSPNGRLIQWRSRKFQGAAQPKFLAPSEENAPYVGIVPGGTRSEVRFGIDLDNVAVSGSNNRIMTGNAAASLPTTDFTWFMKCRVFDPTSITILMATQGVTDQAAWGVSSAQALRLYHNYSALQIPSSDGAIDEDPHLLIVKHNRATNMTTMYRDETVIKTATSQTLPAYDNLKLYLAAVNNGGTFVYGQGFAVEYWGIIGTVADEVTLDLVRDVDDERTP